MRCLHLTGIVAGLFCWLSVCAQTAQNQQERIASSLAAKPEVNVSFDDPQEVQRMLDQYDERFAVMDSLVFRIPDTLSAGSALDEDAIDFIRSQRVAAIDQAVEAQIAAMKSNNGLDIRGQVYARPGRNLSYDPDDPLVAYNAKAQAELEWNVFHSSLHKRAEKIRELRIQGELRQLEYEREALEETLVLQKVSVRSRYYGRLLTVLNVHAENLRLLMNTQLYLLQNGKISSDDLLKIINEQADVERQLIAIMADSVMTGLPVTTSVAYISVADTAALMDYIRSEQRDLKRLSLRDELLSVQRKKTDYLQTMDILPFVRYSYYNRPDAHNTYNLDVGVSFKIPLSAETAKKRRALLAEQQVVRHEMEHMSLLVDREVHALLRELDNYNQNIYGEYVRMESLKHYLDARINSYGHVAGEYSRIDRLQEYNAYLQAWERLLAYTYQRDCKLIELQSFIMDEPVSRYLTFEELRSSNLRVSNGLTDE